MEINAILWGETGSGKIRAFIPNNAKLMAKDKKVNIAVPVAVKRFMIPALVNMLCYN
jgi:hypothetical protein